MISTVSKNNNQVDLELCYSNRFADTARRRNLVWRVLTKDFFQRWIRPDNSVLDVGAGYCEFINNIRAARKIALDLNPATIATATSTVQVIQQDISKPWSVRDSSINVVFSSNFIEHLPTKEAILNCLHEAHRVLIPDGTIILLGPNIRFCSDVYWDFFDHQIPLSDRSVAEALALSGFKIDLAIERFLPFTMQNGAPTHPLLLAAYLRMPLFWRLFGKQFLLVASKIAVADE